MTEPRSPMTVRLKPQDYQFFSDVTEQAGIGPGVAARQILELFIRRMRIDGDYLTTLQRLNQALRGGASQSL